MVIIEIICISDHTILKSRKFVSLKMNKAVIDFSVGALGILIGKVMYLQQKDSTWEAIKTWGTAEILNANLTKTWHVMSGYDYRIFATASIVYSTGNELETVTRYSNIVSY